MWSGRPEDAEHRGAVLRAIRKQSMEFGELNVEFGYVYDSTAVVRGRRLAEQRRREFSANPIGHFVDPAAIADDRAAGASFADIHAEAISGGYAPEQAPVAVPEPSA